MSGAPMSTISPPIRCSGGRIGRRAVTRSAFGFLASPLLLIVTSILHFDQMRVFVFLGAATFTLMFFCWGVVVWSHCRWVEFDGFNLRGQRFRPFGSFDCPADNMRRIVAKGMPYGHGPDAHYIQFGKWRFVWITRDMENAAELLAAVKDALDRRAARSTAAPA